MGAFREVRSCMAVLGAGLGEHRVEGVREAGKSCGERGGCGQRYPCR